MEWKKRNKNMKNTNESGKCPIACEINTSIRDLCENPFKYKKKIFSYFHKDVDDVMFIYSIRNVCFHFNKKTRKPTGSLTLFDCSLNKISRFFIVLCMQCAYIDGIRSPDTENIKKCLKGTDNRNISKCIGRSV